MAGVRIEGLDALRAQIRRLPEQLRAEAQQIVLETAELVAERVRAVYRRRAHTGTLARSVRLDRRSRMVAGGEVGAIVRVTAPHAHLVEYGSAARRTRAGKSTGQMPASPTLIPIADRARAVMIGRLVRLLVREGFEVRWP